MTLNDADRAGRSFADLSVHEQCEAIAEEFDAVIDDENAGAADDADDADEADDADDADDRGDPAAEVCAADEAQHLRMLEALLFASAEPLDEAALVRRLPAGADAPKLLAILARQYEHRGVVLSNAAGRWRFITSPDLAHVLEIERIDTRKLSRPALETLAIIAYHQPCTRADIEDVRGVAVSKGSLDQLMEIGWVRLRGRRRDAPGRPVLYGTTPAFLEHFNLDSVGDLPGMADLRAAGLLEARLPPGFTVPTPQDGPEGDDDDAEPDDAIDADGAGAEFVRDFHQIPEAGFPDIEQD